MKSNFPPKAEISLSTPHATQQNKLEHSDENDLQNANIIQQNIPIHTSQQTQIYPHNSLLPDISQRSMHIGTDQDTSQVNSVSYKQSIFTKKQQFYQLNLKRSQLLQKQSRCFQMNSSSRQNQFLKEQQQLQLQRNECLQQPYENRGNYNYLEQTQYYPNNYLSSPQNFSPINEFSENIYFSNPSMKHNKWNHTQYHPFQIENYSNWQDYSSQNHYQQPKFNYSAFSHSNQRTTPSDLLNDQSQDDSFEEASKTTKKIHLSQDNPPNLLNRICKCNCYSYRSNRENIPFNLMQKQEIEEHQGNESRQIDLRQRQTQNSFAMGNFYHSPLRRNSLEYEDLQPNIIQQYGNCYPNNVQLLPVHQQIIEDKNLAKQILQEKQVSIEQINAIQNSQRKSLFKQNNLEEAETLSKKEDSIQTASCDSNTKDNFFQVKKEPIQNTENNYTRYQNSLLQLKSQNHEKQEHFNQQEEDFIKQVKTLNSEQLQEQPKKRGRPKKSQNISEGSKKQMLKLNRVAGSQSQQLIEQMNILNTQQSNDIFLNNEREQKDAVSLHNNKLTNQFNQQQLSTDQNSAQSKEFSLERSNELAAQISTLIGQNKKFTFEEMEQFRVRLESEQRIQMTIKTNNIQKIFLQCKHFKSMKCTFQLTFKPVEIINNFQLKSLDQISSESIKNCLFTLVSARTLHRNHEVMTPIEYQQHITKKNLEEKYEVILQIYNDQKEQLKNGTSKITPKAIREILNTKFKFSIYQGCDEDYHKKSQKKKLDNIIKAIRQKDKKKELISLNISEKKEYSEEDSTSSKNKINQQSNIEIDNNKLLFSQIQEMNDELLGQGRYTLMTEGNNTKSEKKKKNVQKQGPNIELTRKLEEQMAQDTQSILDERSIYTFCQLEQLRKRLEQIQMIEMTLKVIEGQKIYLQCKHFKSKKCTFQLTFKSEELISSSKQPKQDNVSTGVFQEAIQNEQQMLNKIDISSNKFPVEKDNKISLIEESKPLNNYCQNIFNSELREYLTEDHQNTNNNNSQQQAGNSNLWSSPSLVRGNQDIGVNVFSQFAAPLQNGFLNDTQLYPLFDPNAANFSEVNFNNQQQMEETQFNSKLKIESDFNSLKKEDQFVKNSDIKTDQKDYQEENRQVEESDGSTLSDRLEMINQEKKYTYSPFQNNNLNNSYRMCGPNYDSQLLTADQQYGNSNNIINNNNNNIGNKCEKYETKQLICQKIQENGQQIVKSESNHNIVGIISSKDQSQSTSMLPEETKCNMSEAASPLIMMREQKENQESSFQTQQQQLLMKKQYHKIISENLEEILRVKEIILKELSNELPELDKSNRKYVLTNFRCHHKNHCIMSKEQYGQFLKKKSVDNQRNLIEKLYLNLKKKIKMTPKVVNEILKIFFEMDIYLGIIEDQNKKQQKKKLDNIIKAIRLQEKKSGSTYEENSGMNQIEDNPSVYTEITENNQIEIENKNDNNSLDNNPNSVLSNGKETRDQLSSQEKEEGKNILQLKQQQEPRKKRQYKKREKTVVKEINNTNSVQSKQEEPQQIENQIMQNVQKEQKQQLPQLSKEPELNKFQKQNLENNQTFQQQQQIQYPQLKFINNQDKGEVDSSFAFQQNNGFGQQSNLMFSTNSVFQLPTTRILPTSFDQQTPFISHNPNPYRCISTHNYWHPQDHQNTFYHQEKKLTMFQEQNITTFVPNQQQTNFTIQNQLPQIFQSDERIFKANPHQFGFNESSNHDYQQQRIEQLNQHSNNYLHDPLDSRYERSPYLGYSQQQENTFQQFNEYKEFPLQNNYFQQNARMQYNNQTSIPLPNQNFTAYSRGQNLRQMNSSCNSYNGEYIPYPPCRNCHRQEYNQYIRKEVNQFDIQTNLNPLATSNQQKYHEHNDPLNQLTENNQSNKQLGYIDQYNHNKNENRTIMPQSIYQLNCTPEQQQSQPSQDIFEQSLQITSKIGIDRIPSYPINQQQQQQQPSIPENFQNNQQKRKSSSMSSSTQQTQQHQIQKQQYVLIDSDQSHETPKKQDYEKSDYNYEIEDEEKNKASFQEKKIDSKNKQQPLIKLQNNYPKIQLIKFCQFFSSIDMIFLIRFIFNDTFVLQYLQIYINFSSYFFFQINLNSSLLINKQILLIQKKY